MGKQIFDRTRKMLSILLLVFFVVSLTGSSVNATAPAENATKTNNNISAPAKSHMNPNWGSRDKQHYVHGYNEGYRVGLINGYDQGFDLGVKGLKYTSYKYFPTQSSKSQDIGYADGYNAGYDARFLSGYNAGLSAYKHQQHHHLR